jgi:hypothetical protein
VTTPTSIDNKKTKVKKLKENGFCVFLFFCFFLFRFCFVVGPFFLHFRQTYKVFYHQESSHYIQIKHNKKLILQREKLRHNLGISWFLS